jgi:transposase
LLSEYGGGVSVARVDEMLRVPIVTIVRLLAAMRRRRSPHSVRPGTDATPEGDAAMIAELERKIRERDGRKNDI